MTVLDASAVLAIIQNEPGAAFVAESLDGAAISAVNVAEVVGKLADAGVDGRMVGEILGSGGTVIEPFTADDAVIAGALRTIVGGRRLSLGDRCCLALALRPPGRVVLTADRAWAALELPIDVRLIR